jgi:hypothetical protein
MITKNLARIILPLVIILGVFCAEIAAAEDALYEVTVKARGANEQEALEAAIDEAIRNTLGSIFAERSELGGEMLEEKLIQYSRGFATNYKIIEKLSDESGTVVTVVVTVDSRKIKDNARVMKEGSGGGNLEQWQSPLLESGGKKIADFFSGVRYENFLNVALTGKKSDPRKGKLDMSVSLAFDKGRFYKEFSAPAAKTLDDIFGNADLRDEIEGEFQSPDERYSVSFEIMGENLSVKSWTLPRNFFDAIKRSSGFWVAANGRIATHKRLWLHFSLLDSKGTELERLPVHLFVSNVIFFSENRKDSNNPWFYLGLSGETLKSYASVTAAPFYGMLSKGNYRFFDSIEEEFEFDLPQALLEKVSDVLVSLELER